MRISASPPGSSPRVQEEGKASSQNLHQNLGLFGPSTCFSISRTCQPLAAGGAGGTEVHPLKNIHNTSVLDQKPGPNQTREDQTQVHQNSAPKKKVQPGEAGERNHGTSSSGLRKTQSVQSLAAPGKGSRCAGGPGSAWTWSRSGLDWSRSGLDWFLPPSHHLWLVHRRPPPPPASHHPPVLSKARPRPLQVPPAGGSSPHGEEAPLPLPLPRPSGTALLHESNHQLQSQDVPLRLRGRRDPPGRGPVSQRDSAPSPRCSHAPSRCCCSCGRVSLAVSERSGEPDRPAHSDSARPGPRWNQTPPGPTVSFLLLAIAASRGFCPPLDSAPSAGGHTWRPRSQHRSEPLSSLHFQVQNLREPH